MKKKKKPGLLKTVLLDVLLAALIVGGWPVSRMIAINAAAKQFHASAAQKPATAAVASTPAPVETPAATAEPEPEDTLPPEPTPTPEPDNRTEWQKKFEEHFTDEVVSTDMSYTSPNISVTVTKNTFVSESGNETVYFAADIYIASIECFQSYFAHGLDYPSRTGLIPDMVAECGSIIAMNGDYCGRSYGGIVLRNGTMCMNSPNGSEICILFKNGEMECMGSYDFRADAYPEGDIYQIWTFGPSLLAEDGRALAKDEMDVPSYLISLNPRTALGYYEPGHYCFMVADGRQSGYSSGLAMEEVATIMSDLGCKLAYNLDGGGSSMMYMNGQFVNKSSSGGMRDVPDILIIKDIAPAEGGEQ